MEAPVNFDNLRNITGGDAATEALLFTSFLSGAFSCLQQLHVAWGTEDETLWRQQAHGFRGICLNLGAQKLSGLCEQAQMDWRASTDEKRALLDAIEQEFTRVRSAIRL